jgi:RNA polymerase sigma-70 factor (ECF subfamily)
MRRRKSTFEELEPGDRALAERMLAGDEEAFEEFFEGHFPGLYRFALRRLRDPELTRDVVQSAICKAIANLRSYRGEATLAAWLFTICRYEINAHFRRRKRRPSAVELVEEEPSVRAALDSLPAAFPGPEEALDDKEVAELVHATLDRLPPRYGQVLEWKYLDGVPVKEIAGRLQLGAKAAESLLTRARKAFRDGFSTYAAGLERSRSTA